MLGVDFGAQADGGSGSPSPLIYRWQKRRECAGFTSHFLAKAGHVCTMLILFTYLFCKSLCSFVFVFVCFLPVSKILPALVC